MNHPALTAFDLGYSLAINEREGKAPIHKGFLDRELKKLELIYRTRAGFNWSFILKGLVVVDKDAKSRKAYDWMRHRGVWRSPMMVETRRGIHVYFRLPEVTEDVRSKLHFAGLPVDILTGRRAALGPGSTTVEDGVPFSYALRDGCEIVPPEELPVFPIDILERREEVRASIKPLVLMTDLDERAMRYIDKIPPAVQGEGGSRACFVAMLKILSLTGGDIEKAWPLALYWNAKCVPVWDTEKEDGPDSLRRKLREAAKCWRPR